MTSSPIIVAVESPSPTPTASTITPINDLGCKEAIKDLADLNLLNIKANLLYVFGVSASNIDFCSQHIKNLTSGQIPTLLQELKASLTNTTGGDYSQLWGFALNVNTVQYGINLNNHTRLSKQIAKSTYSTLLAKIK